MRGTRAKGEANSTCLNTRNPEREMTRGQGGIRTPEGRSQQIYSLPRLTTSVPTHIFK